MVAKGYNFNIGKQKRNKGANGSNIFQFEGCF